MWWDHGNYVVEDDPVRGSEFIPRTVTEYEDGPVFSGIIDKDGNQIMRWTGMDPIGFVTFEEDEEENE